MIMVIGPHKRKTEAMAAAKADRATERASREHRPCAWPVAQQPEAMPDIATEAEESAPAEAPARAARPAAATPAPAPASPAPASPAPASSAPASSGASGRARVAASGGASSAAPAGGGQSGRAQAERAAQRGQPGSPARRARVGHRVATALSTARYRGSGQDHERGVRDRSKARPGPPVG